MWPLIAAAVGGGILLNKEKNKYNAGIDAQIAANQMKRPDPIDPNSLGSNQQELMQRYGQAGQASPWLGMAQAQANQQAGFAAQQAQGAALGAAAQGRAQLASRGGLSGGAAERMARQGAQNSMIGQQQVAQQNMMNQSNLAMKDYSQNVENTNVWARMAQDELNNKNAVRMNNFNQGMQAWAGNQAANAELNQSKKSGLLGLGFLGL